MVRPGAALSLQLHRHRSEHWVVVSGELIGDCHAAHRVEIQATGRLTGNIRAPRVVIAEGAVFKGNSDMTARKG